MRRSLLCLLVLVSSSALAQVPGSRPSNQPSINSPAAPAAAPAVDTGATKNDVVYGKANGVKLRLDIYQPHGGTKPYTAILLIHGGAWTSLDKTSMAAMGRWLARNGFVAFSIDYRLFDGKNDHWPAQLDDAQRAVRWIRANAEKYEIDPAHIGAFGHSAGAQMVSLLGEVETRDNSDPELAAFSSRVQAVVDYSGPVNFTHPWDPGTREFFGTLLGATEAANPALWKSASPALNIGKDTAPFLILHGTKDVDVPISQAEEFAASLEKAGIPVTLIKVEDGHTFEAKENRQRLALETVAFFTRTLKPAAIDATPPK